MKQLSQELSHTSPDVIIAGGGIIGLSLAIELDARGARVTVLERGRLLAQASTAAAGMLALHDPHNPPALLPFARYSAALYPRYLERLQLLAGTRVPLQTAETTQHHADGSTERLCEFSLDPRQLSEALCMAVASTRITVLEDAAILSVEHDPHGLHAVTRDARRIDASALVLATGAWGDIPSLRHVPVHPRKGQMLRVKLPNALEGLREVHRNGEIYVVPRTQGPQAGSALIGATIEDAGFDVSTSAKDLALLRHQAASLLPELASAADAPELEAWAGLRPATPDELPVLGALGEHRTFAALGHYRNGILLAPATAQVIADMVEGRPALADLASFSPLRFISAERPSHS